MMQENNAITLDNGKKYLLLHDLEEINGKRYFYAIGLKEDESLDMNDAIFFEVTNEDGAEYVEKVDPTTDLFKTLTAIEFIDSKIDEDPSYEKALEDFVATVERQETSSN